MNPEIQLNNVNRRYYNKYYYKLEMGVVGSAFLRYPELTIERQIEMREGARSVSYGGSWRRRIQLPTPRDIELLEAIRKHKPDFENRIQFRVEEPYLQIYSDDEQTLYEFAVAVSGASTEHIKKIFRPKDDHCLDLLKQGYTISSVATQYPFKVSVREGRYNIQTKRQILSYLQSIPELVKLPDHFVSAMSKDFESIWNCYFYIQDRDICTMLALINPSFVRTIEEYYTVESDAK